ncbi:MAG: hypothetical protein Q8O84_05610 [Nanoarchaeota archaeon]|nr:hypothetical protein [Nanoarchaeota archaeon]
MTNYKTSIEQMKNEDDEPSPDYLKYVLREICFEKDAVSAINLTNSMAENYIRNCPKSKRPKRHFDAYFIVRKDLSLLAEGADDLFGEKNIQKFYLDSVRQDKKKYDPSDN